MSLFTQIRPTAFNRDDVVLCHELGHTLTWLNFGRPIGPITFHRSPRDGLLEGGAALNPPQSLACPTDAEHLAERLLAGESAARRKLNLTRNEISTLGIPVAAHTDIPALLRAANPKDDAFRAIWVAYETAKSDWYEWLHARLNRAIAIVDKNWGTIESLAQSMRLRLPATGQKTSFTDAEVMVLVGQHGGLAKNKIGILAFGSLINDPGRELLPRIIMRIKTQTPFGVEYGRYSGRTRGGAPTLAPHQAGNPVGGEILVLGDALPVSEARNMLWRRERRKEETREVYVEGASANSVIVREWVDSPFVERVLYTDFLPAGKIVEPKAKELAESAIQSVKRAAQGMDGISYLANNLTCGIKTKLTDDYATEILKQTNTGSLADAQQKAAIV